MDKTIVVEHVARVPHPRFNKIVKRSKKYYVHDENGEAKVGDRVRIVETRPLSKLKCWTPRRGALPLSPAPPDFNSQISNLKFPTAMIQMESKLAVADNTGARTAKMIGVLGKRTRTAGIGDIITAHVRESIPTAVDQEGQRGQGRGRPHRLPDPPRRRLGPALRRQRHASSSTRTTTRAAPASSDPSPANCARRSS